MGSSESTPSVTKIGLTSSTEFGQQCVFSEPFDQHATAEEFFEAVLGWYQTAKTPIDGSVPKSVRIIDKVPGYEFTTVAVWDGELSRAHATMYNLENVPECGDYFVKTRIVYDWNSLSIKETRYVGGQNSMRLLMNARAIVHRNPARLEWSAMDRCGLHPSFFATAGFLQQVVADIFGIVTLQTMNTIHMAIRSMPHAATMSSLMIAK